MISPGSVVRVRRLGDVAWVVHSKMFDNKWKVVSKAVDGRGGAMYTSRIVGERYIVPLYDPPIFAVGDSVMHDGMAHTIVAVTDDHVVVRVPERSRSIGRGHYLRLAAGNTLELSLADLVLEDLR